VEQYFEEKIKELSTKKEKNILDCDIILGNKNPFIFHHTGYRFNKHPLTSSEKML